MLQTHAIDPEDPHPVRGRLSTPSPPGVSRQPPDAFARRRADRGPLVRLDGRLPDGAQGDLGVAPQAAPGRCPHHQGRGRNGASRRLPAVRHPVRDHRHLDDQDRPPAGDRRLARPGVHENGGVRLREGLLPPAGAVGGGCPGSPPPIPRQAQPAAPARHLGRMALGAGPERRGDSPPPVGGRLRLPVAPPRPRSCGRTCPTRWRRAG